MKYENIFMTLELLFCGTSRRACAVNLTTFMLAGSSKKIIHGLGFCF